MKAKNKPQLFSQESPTHYQLFPTVPHSGAHREYEGEKPWPKLVGLQRTGRILWPANGWVSFCNTGGCWTICFRSIFCGKNTNFRCFWNVTTCPPFTRLFKKKMLQKIANLCLLPFGGKKKCFNGGASLCINHIFHTLTTSFTVFISTLK